MSARLGRFMKCIGLLITTLFAYRIGLGTCDALLWVSHTLQSALLSGQEALMTAVMALVHPQALELQ